MNYPTSRHLHFIVSKNREGSKPPLLNWLGLDKKVFERQDLISCQRICDTFLNGSQFGSILRYQHRLVMHFIGVPMINGPQCLQALIKELLLVPQWGFTCVGGQSYNIYNAIHLQFQCCVWTGLQAQAWGSCSSATRAKGTK